MFTTPRSTLSRTLPMCSHVSPLESLSELSAPTTKQGRALVVDASRHRGLPSIPSLPDSSHQIQDADGRTDTHMVLERDALPGHAHVNHLRRLTSALFRRTIAAEQCAHQQPTAGDRCRTTASREDSRHHGQLASSAIGMPLSDLGAAATPHNWPKPTPRLAGDRPCNLKHALGANRYSSDGGQGRN